MAWLLRELIRFGVDDFLLLTGPLQEDAVAAAVPGIAATLPRKVRIACASAPSQAGAGGALWHARDRLAERFLLCNGGAWLDFNLARLLADAALDPAGTVRMVHRLTASSRDGVARAEAIDAGIYLFDRLMLGEVTPTCSLRRDVLPRLAARGALRITSADQGAFFDLGNPGNLARELPVLLHRRALFLDRDGVINVDHGWVGSREQFVFVPGALQAIAAAVDAGLHVFVASNQSGIARGLYDEAQFASLSAWMTDQVRAAGGTIDDLRHCPYHPQASVAAYRRTSDWRKPAPGMLLDLLARWEVDPARSLLVGDQPSDLAAAAAAGIRGHLFGGGNLASFLMPLLQR